MNGTHWGWGTEQMVPCSWTRNGSNPLNGRQEGTEERGEKPPGWNPNLRNGSTRTAADVGSQQQNLNVHALQPTIATYSAKFTVEVAKLETLLSEMHIKNGDLLRTSKNATNHEQSVHHYRQALQILARLLGQALLKQRPCLLYNLQTDQVAAHLGLGCLLRDRNLVQDAIEHLEKALDLTQKLTISEDSPGQQDRLGVILTIQGEILNETKKATPDDRRRALEKQQMAVVIFRQRNRQR